MSLHNTRLILVYLFSRANKDHNKMPRTRSAGLQCCTDRTAAGIMISLQRIAAGIVQTQSVRQTKILIILLSRFAKNCGTNLKCIRDLSTLSKPFPRSPACPSPFLTPARDFEAAAAAMATPSLPPETLHHFPFMLRATRRTDGLHHKLFSPPSLAETPGSSRAADGQRRYVVPRAARLL